MGLQITMSQAGGPSGPAGPDGGPGIGPLPGSSVLGRLPPGALVLLAILSIQLSSAFATFLFADLGPAGTAFLSTGFSAAVLTLVSSPKLDRRLRDGAIVILLFGLTDACLALPFFLALQYIPLGIATAIAFIGPLGLAVMTSRRPIHFLAIGIAALGVGLLTPEIGGNLDLRGLALAGLCALAWAAFVPLSKSAGRIFDGRDGLTLGLWVASLMLLPFALAEGTIFHAGGIEIAGALLVALLNAVLPMAMEFQALQRMSARNYGILMTLEPAVGALVGALMLDQAIGPRMIAAIACVTLAALSITLFDRRGES